MKRRFLALAVTLLVLIFSGTALAAYTKTADNTVPAYTDSSLTRRNGNERVDQGDVVTVHQETGNAYYVTYPVRNGTKTRWVPKSIFNSSLSTATISNGWYQISPAHDTGRVLDVAGIGTADGTNLQMWSRGDVSQQKFYVQNRDNGYFSLKAGHCDLYITADGNNPGANLSMRRWSNSDAQLFRLVNSGNGYYYIMAKVGSQLIFDCAGGGRRDGNNVGLWCLDNQTAGWYKWKFTSTGGSASYDSKVSSFINNSSYAVGSEWDCFAYATQFVNQVHNKSGVRDGTPFYSANEIRNGDVVHVNPANGTRQHWIVVLYRNGNQLTKIEGNWSPKGRNYGKTYYSNSAYTIQNNTLYRNGSKFRAWDMGYHY